MIRSTQLVAVLDACVLYPAPIRDLLLHFAEMDLYAPKWTDRIQNEWVRTILANRPDLKIAQLQNTVDAMNQAFPGANVLNYESLINAFTLPDQDDRHILAAAVRCNAGVIVTANMKDFPSDYLLNYKLEAQHPDSFSLELIEMNPESSLVAFKKLVSKLKKPPRTEVQVLTNFRKVNLVNTADRLLELINKPN